ncbi:Rab3 GTPase-activating protein catalytic subunit [Mortierella antarctica]|nr:Rab3 GTPase-activating protein catalytic subunit [Mortierella antarctica]
MDDFENFEFIDYTTSGPWERFITQIEDSLRSWGLVDRSLGVLDPACIETARESDSANNTEKSSGDQVGGDQKSQSQSQGCNKRTKEIYQLKEMLSLGDATYALSYQYHPAKARASAGAKRIDLDFLPTTLEGTQHHSLHRWTSLTHILIISPVTISDIFASSSMSSSSAIIDLSSAKLLLSSFAIAFQNTDCSVPVFVPTGQPWNLTFTGLSMNPQPHHPTTTPAQALGAPEVVNPDPEEEVEDDRATEMRFNTILVPYPPVQYTSLSGILDFFVERMGIEDECATTSTGDHGQGIKDKIHVAALFSYDLVNWYDEDWRRWRIPDDLDTKQSAPGDSSGHGTFLDDVGPTMSLSGVDLSMEDIKAEGRSLSRLPIPALPFGPAQDPLRSLRLFARFARAPITRYLDSSNTADMDASHANIWILHAQFKGDDYGILSGILEDAISSWSSEFSSGGRAERKSDKERRTYGALLNKGAKLIQGTITMVDTVDVENIVDALFGRSSTSQPLREPSTASSGARPIRLVPASELGLHFRHATTVPYDSFLWRMIQYLVDVISPNSDISYATSIMGFLKVLWSELLKQLYSRWENSQLIPLVDIYGDGYSNVSKKESKERFNAGPEEEKKPVAIDLRYNLLHQKLSMLNCCIARQIVRNKEAPTHVHPMSKRRIRRRAKSKEMEIPDAESLSSAPPADEPTYGAQLQNLLHGFSDISRPRSADVVPMAKRLLKTVKGRSAPPETSLQSDPSLISALSLEESSHRAGANTELSSPTASLPIPRMEMFRSRRRSSQHLRRHNSHHFDHLYEESLGSDEDEDDVFYDPMEMTESILDQVSEDALHDRRHQSLTESFVALKYSSSADSQSGILVTDIDQTSVNSSGPDPREVSDETKSEGGLQPLKDLKLLKTGAPLMIPKLQEPGYMTEDMIQQQEELFETLGSSSDGAKMRAKMQSTQLISDMEAFKAANPGCVLGDFIRWHSPKDWVEDKGEMSARMADAGNYWQELWANSKRIPVSRQTPLFNHNQEAAKALFYLDSMSSGQLFIQLLPTICLLAYDTLVSHPVASHVHQVAAGLKELGQELTEFSWNELAGDEELNLDVIVDKFREVELLMGRAIALIRKFPEQYGLVERILEDHEATIEDGPERECVYDLFSIGGSIQSSFPQPTSREFILEAYDPSVSMQDEGSTATFTATKSAVWDSRPLQRRLYACFRESELRIVEAVATDGMYM